MGKKRPRAGKHIFFFAKRPLKLRSHTPIDCVEQEAVLAQRRLPLNFMRAINFQFRTTFHAGLLPPLRHHEVVPKVNRSL